MNFEIFPRVGFKNKKTTVNAGNTGLVWAVFLKTPFKDLFPSV
jgi:hypothetical protein